MSTWIIVWYALGWVGIAIYANEFGRLTLGELIVNLMLGPIAACVHAIGWCMVHDNELPSFIIYDRSKGGSE